MVSKTPRRLSIVAMVQFIPILLLPPETLAGVGLLPAIVLVVMFSGLGLLLLQRRSWARVMSVFIQGLNIIVRLLNLLPNAAVSTTAGVEANLPLLVTSLTSIALSALIIREIDRPETLLAMR